MLEPSIAAPIKSPSTRLDENTFDSTNRGSSANTRSLTNASGVMANMDENTMNTSMENFEMNIADRKAHMHEVNADCHVDDSTNAFFDFEAASRSNTACESLAPALLQPQNPTVNISQSSDTDMKLYSDGPFEPPATNHQAHHVQAELDQSATLRNHIPKREQKQSQCWQDMDKHMAHGSTSALVSSPPTFDKTGAESTVDAAQSLPNDPSSLSSLLEDQYPANAPKESTTRSMPTNVASRIDPRLQDPNQPSVASFTQVSAQAGPPVSSAEVKKKESKPRKPRKK